MQWILVFFFILSFARQQDKKTCTLFSAGYAEWLWLFRITRGNRFLFAFCSFSYLFAIKIQPEPARDWINIKTPNRGYFAVKKSRLVRSSYLAELSRVSGADADLELKYVLFVFFFGFDTIRLLVHQIQRSCL